MLLYLKLCFVHVILLQCFTDVITAYTNSSNSSCIQAAAMSTEKTSCVPIQYNTYCKNKGILLDEFAFVTNNTQKKNDKTLNGLQNNLSLLRFVGISGFAEKCLKAMDIVFCHHFYPKCDDTGDMYKAQALCKETCHFYRNACSQELKLYAALVSRYSKFDIDCAKLSWRNAGGSPECYYFDEMDDEKGKLNLQYEKDCLHKNGHSYQGNISVTTSGIPCQLWDSQCPHRHTMVSAYRSELRNASNYCRNPRGSGQRPWCFTSDKNKRWEYCDIPGCLPVNGGYGAWTLTSKCSSTCGQGIEEWKRFCDAPAPRYGGNNCSSLANTTEYRNCSNLPPCPVNGNYGRWIRNSTCNVTCGDGFETWIRKCDNPTPAYGGQSCLTIGESETLGSCRITSCQNSLSDINTLKTIIVAGVVAVVLAILICFGILGYRKMKQKNKPNHSHRIVYMKPVDNTSAQPHVAI